MFSPSKEVRCLLGTGSSLAMALQVSTLIPGQCTAASWMLSIAVPHSLLYVVDNTKHQLTKEQTTQEII